MDEVEPADKPNTLPKKITFPQEMTRSSIWSKKQKKFNFDTESPLERTQQRMKEGADLQRLERTLSPRR